VRDDVAVGNAKRQEGEDEEEARSVSESRTFVENCEAARANVGTSVERTRGAKEFQNAVQAMTARRFDTRLDSHLWRGDRWRNGEGVV
jgi:hypothetical protein